MTAHIVIKKKLAKLRDDCNRAIEAVKGDRKFLLGQSLNWADLRCVEAMICTPLECEPFYRVVISEASPDGCATFKRLVGEELAPDWPNLQIDTEW